MRLLLLEPPFEALRDQLPLPPLDILDIGVSWMRSLELSIIDGLFCDAGAPARSSIVICIACVISMILIMLLL